ncbi:hypothetical protein BGZ61DRAFT_515610 [Ilyonectria robusta]|uniref:uncharacterized protein n=1 Tax=Ilyonectria robusta TaxID=1079257 RepID=UPI001E8D2909|nr:uncharacterized protein BGZ61DRAFT_515610 [Ilyonectria robusta]KAH8729575.1 hypothetical protein BGZ61DRAFT_515610 [Ilyonectria robusta]
MALNWWLGGGGASRRGHWSYTLRRLPDGLPFRGYCMVDILVISQYVASTIESRRPRPGHACARWVASTDSLPICITRGSGWADEIIEPHADRETNEHWAKASDQQQSHFVQLAGAGVSCWPDEMRGFDKRLQAAELAAGTCYWHASGFIVIQHCSAEHSGRCGAPLSSLVA